MQIVGWSLAVLASFYLLFAYGPRLSIGSIVKRGVAAVVVSIVTVLGIGLAFVVVGATPSPTFGDTLFRCLFKVVILAMTNIANAAFRGMVETIASFHETHNAANIDRFPIRIIRQRTGLQRFSIMVWWLCSGLMLYGVWFDMHI